MCLTNFAVFICHHLHLRSRALLAQSEATTRTVGQDYRGNTTSRAQRVRTGVLLVTIRTVRMMRGAGTWQVLDETMSGGAPQAQVGTATTPSPIHLSLINHL